MKIQGDKATHLPLVMTLHAKTGGHIAARKSQMFLESMESLIRWIGFVGKIKKPETMVKLPLNHLMWGFPAKIVP